MTEVAISPQPHERVARTDPITLEVLRHALQEIAEEMNVSLMRAAYSTNITDRRDSSCAVYLPSGEPVAQSASGTPLHLGVMPAVVRAVLARVPLEKMKPGDQYLMNTPYPEGPGHLNDLSLVRPVFRNGCLVALVANQAHHIDVGGMTPGSMPADAVEIFQEGLQLPPVALFRSGNLVEETLDIFLANIRTPAVSRGDLLAQAAANKVGTEQVEVVLDRFGEEVLITGMKDLLDHAERRMRAAIAELPDGAYAAQDVIEGPRGPIEIRVTVRIEDDSLTADFAGTSPQEAAPLNCRPATLMACLGYVMKAMLDSELAPNAGTLRPLSVLAEEGSLVCARAPASLVHSNVVTSMRICDVLTQALHDAAPERVTAASAGSQNLVCIGGFDCRRGEPFTYIETHGGGAGASPDWDGQSAVHTHMTNTLNSPVEVLEQDFPFQVLEYALAADSAGAGRQRGGLGIRKRLRVQSPATLTIATDRIDSRPWGLDGGEAGAPGRVSLIRHGRRRQLPARGTFRLEAGDVLILVTPGGGGWGNPRARPKQAVVSDVDAGLVSSKRARDDYGLEGA